MPCHVHGEQRGGPWQAGRMEACPEANAGRPRPSLQHVYPKLVRRPNVICPGAWPCSLAPANPRGNAPDHPRSKKRAPEAGSAERPRQLTVAVPPSEPRSSSTAAPVQWLRAYRPAGFSTPGRPHILPPVFGPDVQAGADAGRIGHVVSGCPLDRYQRRRFNGSGRGTGRSVAT